MFWGLIVEPGNRYSQEVDKAFHVSQAALDAATGDNNPCQVMVIYGGKNYLICTLQKNKCIQVPLDLYFKSGSTIAFMTNGKCNIHLTGYVDPDEYEFDEDDKDDDEEDEAVEDDEEVDELPKKNKRKLESGATNGEAKKAKVSKKKSEFDDRLKELLNLDDLGSDDENDETYQGEEESGDSEPGDDDDDDEDNVDDDEDDEEEEEEDEEMEQDDESQESEANTTLDTSKESTGEKLSKSQKKRLKKKLAQEKAAAAKKEPAVNGVAKKAKLESKEEPSEEKKEKKNVNGVAIEDIKVGAGPVAKNGKVVQVFYEGRLKSNNKMFDSYTKGPGFKFRLGSKEVIKGWDVGVVGMKVGGKRRIVCPPPMAYGAKGSPPVIPPNATLVFEVELKNVK